MLPDPLWPALLVGTSVIAAVFAVWQLVLLRFAPRDEQERRFTPEKLGQLDPSGAWIMRRMSADAVEGFDGRKGPRRPR